MNRLMASLLFSLIFTGCQTERISSNMYFEELQEYSAEMKVEGNELIVVLDNIPGLIVYELPHKIEKDRVLIGAHRISSGGGKHEYRILLSVHTLPHDIHEKIFWLNPDGTTHSLEKYLSN